MKTKIKICFLIIFLMGYITSQSQTAPNIDYRTGIGLRGGGFTSGLTLKHFVSPAGAIEGIVSFPYFRGSALVTVLYEKHSGAFDTERLNWFYGAGGHLGFYNRNHYLGYYNCSLHPNDPRKDRCIRVYDYPERYVNFGIDGIIGIEWQITEIPFTLGVDFKPMIDLVNPGHTWFIWDAGLSFRYVWGGSGD
jgi:hypothetical protein